MNDSATYRHVQIGKAMRALCMGLAGVVLMLGILVKPLAFTALILAPILILSSVVFGILTIEVSPTYLRWWFGFGWPSGVIARADIVDASIESPSLLNGIGLHLTLHGWLWNVTLGDAVGVSKRSGGEVLLGTDDTAGLLAALNGPPKA